MHPRRLAREGILSALYALELTGETKEKVLEIAKPLSKNGYGKYLQKLVEND